MTIQEFNNQLGTSYKSFKTVRWDEMSQNPKLTESIIREFQDKVYWNLISKCQPLSENFIREFQDKVNWYCISKFQSLSDEFIREFQDNVWWDYISIYQHLSEDFIREFQDKVYWSCISKYQSLSEDFIREFQDKVYWSYISSYQHLSEEFIREFQDNVDWYCISKFQSLSDEFIRKFKDDLIKNLIQDSWLYQDTDFKKLQVINTGLYECHDDYFIGYKGIRSDRYSKFNFRYKYENGGIYESWCDCSNNENSFGFSVWDYEHAKNYCDELVVKVKVKYEDVGRVVHDGGKIRCFKLEVLD